MIISISNQIKPGKKLSELLDELNKTEMMIGDWHDRVVLKDFIERFIAQMACPDVEMNALKTLLEDLDHEKVNLELHFMPQVDHILGIALAI